MRVTSRLYRDQDDLLLLSNFLTASRAEVGHCGYFHIGDLLWRTFRDPRFDPTQNIRLWESKAGECLGFAFFYPPDSMDMQIHPRLQGSGLLEQQMLDWAVQRRLELLDDDDDDDAEPPLILGAFADDYQRIAFLTRNGFVKGEECYHHMLRSLPSSPPEATLPEGFSVRHVSSERDVEQRIAIHREVWHPSSFTLEAYQRLRQAPGYIPELDLVVVSPNGTFVAYCICWLDTVNQVGEFEPVGTRAAFRRQGFGTAVTLEGLRRLHSYGARHAIVLSHGDNQASKELYHSVGFHTVNQDFDYVKSS